jgi:hypothetical protein
VSIYPTLETKAQPQRYKGWKDLKAQTTTTNQEEISTIQEREGNRDQADQDMFHFGTPRQSFAWGMLLVIDIDTHEIKEGNH